MNRVPGLVLLAVCGELLLGGGVLTWMGAPGAGVLWAVATGLAAVPAIRWAYRDLRAGRFSVYPPAVLALVGTVLFGDFRAGAVVAVLLLGVRALGEWTRQSRSTKDEPLGMPKSLDLSGPLTPTG